MNENRIRTVLLAGLLGLVVAAVFLPEYLNRRNQGETGRTVSSIFKGRPVVLEYTRPGCGACKEMKPVISKLKEEFEGEVDFVEIDVTDAEAEAFLEKYPAAFVPTFYMLLGEDDEPFYSSGGMSEDDFRSKIMELISESNGRDASRAPGLKFSGQPLVLMFTSRKCPDCELLLPYMEEFEREFGEKIDFQQVALDKNTRESRLLQSYFHVRPRDLPTIYFFDSKKKTVTFSEGPMYYGDIRYILEKLARG